MNSLMIIIRVLAYLLFPVFCLFWIGFLLSKLTSKIELNVNKIVISLLTTWIISAIPGILCGKEIYKGANLFVIIIIVSFVVTVILRKKEGAKISSK